MKYYERQRREYFIKEVFKGYDLIMSIICTAT